MRKFIIIIFSFFYCLTTSGQSISERLLLTDTKDSTYIKASKIVFDKKGNYCFTIKKEEKIFFVTNTDTLGGFNSTNSSSSSGRRIIYTKSYSDPENKPFYFKNADGIKIYGTAVGKIESYQTSNTSENVALITTLGDSVYYYINGELILSKLKDSEEDYGSSNVWASFSENGNKIHTFKPDSLYYLYVNDRIVDSSKFDYIQLAINNEGNYIFARGKRPTQPIGKYNYMFFVHSIDTVLGYVRTVWNYKLKENNAYYYNGDDNGTEYIIINNELHKDLGIVSDMLLIDKNNYLYFFRKKDEEKSKTKINVNGTIYSLDFDEIFLPSINKESDFAFYGLKDFYLYKFINGKKITEPISKYGVRATPIYISPKGESIHYFKNDDSTYLYKDEKLISPPISNTTPFSIRPYRQFLPNYEVQEKITNKNSLLYLAYDTNGYIIFNGKISEPLLPIKERNYSLNEHQLGDIVAGSYNDNGFFVIQKIDSKKYKIIINNEIYKELDEIDYIISESYFFDGKSLIFYGVKNLSFYQFQLNL